MTQLIVALDSLDSIFDARLLAHRLKSELGINWFKLDAYSLMQDNAIYNFWKISEYGNIFLDLKLYGTKDTIITIIQKAFSNSIGAKLITVYGDNSMLQAAISVKPKNIQDAAIIAVRSLTDNPNYALADDRSLLEICDGMICSYPSTALYFHKFFPKKIMICPGIRLEGEEANNHFKPSTPKEAKDLTANFIVVGRPITKAKNPIEIAKKYLLALVD